MRAVTRTTVVRKAQSKDVRGRLVGATAPNARPWRRAEAESQPWVDMREWLDGLPDGVEVRLLAADRVVLWRRVIKPAPGEPARTQEEPMQAPRQAQRPVVVHTAPVQGASGAGERVALALERIAVALEQLVSAADELMLDDGTEMGASGSFDGMGDMFKMMMMRSMFRESARKDDTNDG